MEGVELIHLRLDILQPEPLRRAAFNQRGGRVRIVLQQLGRVSAVIAEIKAAIQRRLVAVPRINNQLPRVLWNGQPVEPVPLDDHSGSLDAHLMELGGHVFQHVHLLRREGVTDRLVPIFPIHAVVGETDLLQLPLPVRTGNRMLALHHQPPELLKEEPKPPRLMLDVLMLPVRERALLFFTAL